MPLPLLGPHLLHVLQHHVAVLVEGFHTAQELFVVAAVDEHLGVVLDRLGEHGEWPCVKLLLLPLLQLLWCHILPWGLSRRLMVVVVVATLSSHYRLLCVALAFHREPSPLFNK